MNYKKAFIKLYGAVGAALDELERAECRTAGIHELRLEEILKAGLQQAEEITLAGGEETKILTISA